MLTSFKMAALASLLLRSRSCILFSETPTVVLARFASKKSGGSSKNLGGKSTGRRYGYKKQDGNFVHAGNILATQRRGLMRWHPGAHVGIGTNKTLYALEDGIVRYTKEVYVPLPRSAEAREAIPQLPKGAVLYKTFVNVVPTKQENKFTLVDMV
ncbi:39S ribosomal protein L27, mitochondrial [Danio aesculapii]|uniref:39S ribosomal protein L27, mitochondrial n=1 Tax=Danio aesculapii TaxID=1142201 RepID=UPI0024BF32A8|nr:39S ribosomal protein L27, mitochondrial [Danio aesculapii]